MDVKGIDHDQSTPDFEYMKTSTKESLKAPGVEKVAEEDGSISLSDRSQQQKSGKIWQTKLLRLGPIAGISCMLLALISILVALGILIGSGGAPVASWSVEPSAILAVCTAVANQALRFAAFQGFVIAWWSTASRGSSLRRLHLNWRAGTTFAGAILVGRNMGLIGLACITSTIVAVDGPLLQKATTVIRVPTVNDTVELVVSMSPEIPRGYTGFWTDQKVDQAAFNFNSTMPSAEGPVPNDRLILSRPDRDTFWNKPWFNDIIPSDIVRGCRGVCTAKVRAPAFARVGYTTREIPVNYSSPVDVTNLINPTGKGAPLNSHAFFAASGLILQGKEKFNLVVGHAETQDCVGTLYMTMSTLVSAIGEYEVTISDGQITLGDAEPNIIAIANNTGFDDVQNGTSSSHPSTFGGIVTSSLSRFQGWISYYPYEGQVKGVQIGPISNQFLLPTYKDETCHSFTNPENFIRQSLNKFMFTIGAVAAREEPSYLSTRLDPGLEVNTTITGEVPGSHNVFKTDLRWFYAAAAVEAFCIALILSTYVGFWRLGRAVSFSPLEVAKAFEAPVLSECGSNSSGKDISKAVGETQVQYGINRTGFGGTKLSFADPDVVDHPKDGSQFDR